MKKINKFMFVLLSITWGGVMSAIGLVVFLSLMLCNLFLDLFHKKHFRVEVKHNTIFVRIGEYWGGVNFGCFSVVCNDAEDDLLLHEAGHGIQNIILGIAFPFVVAIPSFVRYWYREWRVYRKKDTYATLPDYDSIWFEGWATKLGDEYYKEQK